MPGPYIDTKSSLVIVKSIIYRGNTHEWSNRYHTNGPLTLTLGEFENLADAVWADEQSALGDTMLGVRADWADASTATTTNPHGLVTHTKPLTGSGSLNPSGDVKLPGDTVGTIRYSTDARNTYNKPIYLFNYYHGVRRASADAEDALSASFITPMEEYGDDWLAGFSDGTNTHVRCSPRGAVAQARYVKPWIGHRDFPT